MTKEKAIKHLEVIKGDCALMGDNLALDMAISALSAEGEYIKKEDLFNKTIKRNSIWNEITNAEGKGLEEIVNDLLTYSFPDSAKTDTAKPEEGAELIDRRQIKWYGCDHEGHIKGIDCDTADCSQCFFATVEHDEVMSLPVCRIPDSAENKGAWISHYDEDAKEGWYECSCCHSERAFNTNFCPDCGADMRLEPYKGAKMVEPQKSKGIDLTEWTEMLIHPNRYRTGK